MPSVFWPADSSNDTRTWTVVCARAWTAPIVTTSKDPAINEARPGTDRARMIDMVSPPSGVMEFPRPYEGSRFRTRGGVGPGPGLREVFGHGLFPVGVS